MKVKMLPHVSRLGDATSGIARVVEAYFKHLPAFGIEMVGQDSDTYDLKAVHAGMTGSDCDVCHCHGLYWTEDYQAPEWEFRTNARVISAIKSAREITVPSDWVAETFRRDMRISPWVIPHGIDWKEWQDSPGDGNYILWNKNRTQDVCSIEPLEHLARTFPDGLFLSTFELPFDNVKSVGVVPHAKMKKIIQGALVYLSTTKETFGIGILEAMASGIPVLGYAHGGNLDLIEHGVNGFLAMPGDLDGLTQGLTYCIEHRHTLGENGRELAKRWTWESACEQVYESYKAALAPEEPTIAVIIPSYNYGDLVERAVNSARKQTYKHLTDIVVVDDGSNDNGKTKTVVEAISKKDHRVKYIRQDNSGVAVARNHGISSVQTKYIMCLDADDEIAPTYIQEVIKPLEEDRSVGISFSGMMIRYTNGKEQPGFAKEPNFDEQLMGTVEGVSNNQVPTCCIFRRDVWKRLGGYRQRYAPIGCGTEDAELWLRIGAYGSKYKLATKKPLFYYFIGGMTTGNRHYREVDYTSWHPWTKDGRHPFASEATPKNYSHPVRQYDEPTISVIIPVGAGHETMVINALDSLEAQTFRKWEAIVVWDTKESYQHITDAYPYVRLLTTDSGKGAGYSRNIGVDIARAPLLFFLDADDWLFPSALETLLSGFGDEHSLSIVYSDCLGIAYIQEGKYLEKLRTEDRVWNRGDDNRTVFLSRALEYDQEKAIRQPDLAQPYIWCNISSLVPASWHYEIGKFDESMKSWEDWDYWIRMAYAGKCFTRINEPLLIYQFHTGDRRETGLQITNNLVNYMRTKYGGIRAMACSGCGKQTHSLPRNRTPISNTTTVRASNVPIKANDDDFVLVRYNHPNRGDHRVIGSSRFDDRIAQNMVWDDGWRIDYGYRRGGGEEQFLVHRNDVELSQYFVPVEATTAVVLPKRQTAMPATPRAITKTEKPLEPIEVAMHKAKAEQPPVEEKKVEKIEDAPVMFQASETAKRYTIDKKIEPDIFDIQLIPGITTGIKAQLNDMKINSIEGIVKLGKEGLMELKGVGEIKAELIIHYCQDKLEKEKEQEASKARKKAEI